MTRRIALTLCLALAGLLVLSAAAGEGGGLQGYFSRAQDSGTEFADSEPAYAGKILIVASERGGVVTSADQELKLNFGAVPKGRLTDSLDEADTLVLIYPEYKVVGHYTPMVSARRTLTKVCVIDLRGDVLYEPFVAASAEPPRSVTIKTMNGIPMRNAFNGDFLPQKAVDRVAAELKKQAPAEEEPAGADASPGKPDKPSARKIGKGGAKPAK